MAKDPAFLFYSQDFFLGTSTMSYEDRGKYITILCVMHQQGRLSEESIRLLVGSVSVSLKSKFKTDENGLWFNERLEEEVEKRRMFVNSRKINGSKGGRPKNEKPSAKPSGLPLAEASENLIEIENKDENFNDNYNEIESILEIWNNFAEQYNLAKIIKLSDKRKSNVKNRISEKEFDLGLIFDKIKQSDFLLGRNGQSWKVDFDFVFGSKNNYLKILEGRYNGKLRSEQYRHNTEEKLRAIANDIANDRDLK